MARRTKGEGSVFTRSDGRCAAQATFEGKRITKYGKTEREAKQKLNAYLDDLKAGRIVLGPKQTVKEYFTNWLENEHRLEIGPVSLQQYRSFLRAHIIPAFGHLQLSQLTREHIQAYYAKLLDGGSAAKTVRDIHSLLSCGLARAVENGFLAKNPCKRVVLPRVLKKQHHALNKEQALRLVEAARDRRLWFLVLMALTTGMRLGELLALHWEDIDLNNSRIRVHRTVSHLTGQGQVERLQPKTASGVRSLVLTQVVVDGIGEQRRYIDQIRQKAGERWDEKLDLVFPNRYGRYMIAETVRRELTSILFAAGLDRRTFHKLRHSVATILFAAGVNPKIIQEMLGHSRVSITLDLYGDVLPDMQKQAGDFMNDIFKEEDSDEEDSDGGSKTN